jgi:hypothetical protein
MAISTTFTSGQVFTAADANLMANSGMTYITAGTASAQNRLNIPSCFSATYDAYRVEVTNLTHSTANNLILRFSASGSDTAGSNYATQRSEVNGGAISGVSITGSSAIFPSYANSSAGSFVSMSFDIMYPFAAAPTTCWGTAARVDGSTNLYNVNFAGLLNDSTSYNGFSLVGNTGNITCGVRVYGYRQA